VIKFTSFTSSRVLINTINNLATHLDCGMLTSRQMKKSDLAKEMARRNGGDASDAADQLDSVVNGIIRTLRSGKAARLPGLGTITPGKKWTFQPERNDA
jgi:hypothetical protein